MDQYDWYLIPVMNPDGYEYSHTTDRLWRKNRNPNGQYNSRCYGTDLNRNWDFHWNEASTSSDPCSEIYPGQKPFSELETQIVKKFMETIKDDIKLFLSFHSYSQLWLLPWSYTDSIFPNDNQQLQRIANLAVKSLQSKYDVIHSGADLYMASGTSMDYVKSQMNVSYTYTIELGPDVNDTNNYGFILPPSYIIPTGKEMFDAIITILLKN